MSTLARLLSFTTPYRGWIALAVVLGAATVGSSVGLLATSAYLISAAALQPSIADLGVAIVGVRFFGLSRGVFRYLERLISHGVNFRLLAGLRVWFYQAVEPLAPASLIRQRSGDLLARAVADVDTLQDFYVRVLAPPLVAVLVALGMAVFLWAFAPALAAVLLTFLALGGIALPVMTRRLSRRPGADLISARAALYTETVDLIQGLADLTAFGRQADWVERVRGHSEAHTEAQRQTVWLAGAQGAAGNLVMHLGMWAVLVIGISLVGEGRVSGVFLATVTLAALAAFEAVLPLPHAAQALETALAAGRRLFEVADRPPAVFDPATPQTLDRADGVRLAVRGVSFAYAADALPALRQVSLDLPPGRRVAVVGPSGAGKSTLINLLLRFWDAGQGEITLNGVDIRRVAQDDARRVLGVIPQDAYLFYATVRENILIARPSASAAEVEAAARQAQVHAFILSLPQGYDTFIGERGLSLSGGERQRLAVARALLRDAPILLLDEPTANLDSVTEAALLDDLLDASRDRSVLLVTHRLVGMERMDEIVVLQDGQVVERGRHADLLAQGGLYRRLWDLQNRTLMDEVL